MNGTVAVAMHCHGGHRGGSYELLYLYARLSHALSAPPEDSIDFYLREAATGLDYKWEDLADNQAVLRFADGTYHLTSNEIIRKMNDLRGSDAWADEVEYEVLAAELSRRQPECREPELVTQQFSGEDRRPVQKDLAGSAPAPSTCLQDSVLSDVIEELRRIKEQVSALSRASNSSARPKNAIRTQYRQERNVLLQELLQQLKNTDLPTLPQVQSSQASPSSSNVQQTYVPERKALRKKKSKSSSHISKNPTPSQPSKQTGSH